MNGIKSLEYDSLEERERGGGEGETLQRVWWTVSYRGHRRM